MRLIDADALKRSFNKLCDRFGEDFHISAIETEIDAAQTVDAAEVLRNQWISVEDRLPETEDEVLVLTMSKNGNINVDKGYFANGRFVHRGRAEVTHWMPLPEPPEVGKP